MLTKKRAAAVAPPVHPVTNKRACAPMVLSREHKCAAIVQRAWKRTFCLKMTRDVVNSFMRTGPTVEHVKSISFESLVVMLREPKVIAVSKACLQRVHLMCTFRHGSPSRALAPENVNVRVFLAGFMIAYRPTHVFESMGALEHALLEATTPLLTTFDRICRILNEKHFFSEVPPDLTKDFSILLFEYLKRFKAWKVPDEAKLTCRIKHALIALYQAEDHLPADEPADSKLKLEFRTQIERLRSKLQQIAGAEALQKFDEDRLSGILPGSNGGGGGGGNDKGTGGGAYAALPGRMTNEQLAHELLLDPAFQLDESGGCSVDNPVFHRIRESFHAAFWDSLVDDLRLATPCYVRVLRVLAEIRDGIKDLAGAREAGALDEAVDLDFIKQQAEAGLYDWTSCTKLVSSIVEIIQRIQAPKRDDETKAKWTEVSAAMQAATMEEHPRAFCKALEFLLDRVNAMRIDAANNRLRLIAPVIKDHGVDYERGKFQDKLNDGSLTTERTEAWIRASVRREVGTKALDLDSLLEGKAHAFVRVHSAGMLQLVTGETTIKADMVPETLLFDVHRLALLQREFQTLTTATTVMVTMTHALTATKKAGDAELLRAIADEVLLPMQEFDLAQTTDALSAMLEQRSSLSEDMRKTLLRSVVQCSSPTDAVNKLIATRVTPILAKIMQLGSEAVLKDTKLMQVAKFLFARFDKLATKLMSLANLNRTVHLPTYNLLIGKATLELRAA